jgi:hypothetical protein
MIDFEALKKMDLYVVNKSWTPEEEDEFSKFLAERKKKNAKLIARIEDKMGITKTSAKAKSRKGIKA